jgi:hypothetical protein
MAPVGTDVHPVVLLVNVNVAVPTETPVTTPLFDTVAIAGLLLVHVPPVVGDNLVGPPMHMVVLPVMATVGLAMTVTVGVGADAHPLELVNVNVTVPVATPVTTPALVTVALALLLLVHVPPVVGDKVVVPPIHTEVLPVIDAVGLVLTVTVGDGLDWHPVVVLVNVKLTVPADTPVATPLLVIVATAGLLLTHVPPVVGDKLVVLPTHIEVLPDTLAFGLALTVIVGVGVDAQPVVLDVNVNVTVPAATPVTTPAFVTVALATLLLAHVPPVVGDSVVVLPTHTAVAPVIDAIGLALTVMTGVGLDWHPVVLLVKVNVTVPAETPVTTPEFDTVATAVLLLTHVPPVVGERVVVLPAQIVLFPVIAEVGLVLMVTADVGFDTHPVVLVNVNVTVPAETPVTIPSLVTVALVILLLTHVPPVVGERVVVDWAHIDVRPVIATIGFALMVTAGVGLEGHPVAVLVKLNVT